MAPPDSEKKNCELNVTSSFQCIPREILATPMANGQTAIWPNGRSAKRSFGRSAERSNSRSAVQPNGRTAMRPFGRTAEWLAGRPNGRSAASLNGRSIVRPNGHSAFRPNGRFAICVVKTRDSQNSETLICLILYCNKNASKMSLNQNVLDSEEDSTS